MEIKNEFEVPQPVDAVWKYMLDIERVVPCMPGASLTETVDDSNWKGKLTVKLGPVSLNFGGKVQMAERDDANHRVVLKASGMEQRGKGAASATVTSNMEAIESGTKVTVVQDVRISGQAAQFSRGMMQDVSAKLTDQFAECLKTNMSAEQEAASSDQAAATTEPEQVASPAAAQATGTGGSAESPPQPSRPLPAVAAKPVGGIRLLLGAAWGAIVRFFKRLFGRSS
jgi:carbon monoxide dehydrogenase subunit G